MEIRAAVAGDLPRLEEHWPAPGGVHAGHLRAQESRAATFLVAWDGDQPLGSAMVQYAGPVGPRARSAYPDAVEVNHVQVREEHRGRGVGTALLTHAEDLVRSHGRRLIAVGVGEDNDGAARLYERLGYRRTGVTDTTEYDWVDADGAVHQAVERDELLVREL